MADELQCFVAAQDSGGTYRQAVAELRAGRKTSHWMWFVFPQIAGLGHSSMAVRYALSSVDEARAYLKHPVLGPRLLECLEILEGHTDRSAVSILGATDAMKLRSSVTLFLRTAPEVDAFRRVLDAYFDGAEDPETVRRLTPS